VVEIMLAGGFGYIESLDFLILDLVALQLKPSI
jgi:hypothetical protein